MAATTRHRRATWVAYLPYLLPGLIAFGVVIGYPLATNVYYSLFRWKGGLAKMNWYGLGNYTDLLADDAVMAGRRLRHGPAVGFPQPDAASMSVNSNVTMPEGNPIRP